MVFKVKNNVEEIFNYSIEIFMFFSFIQFLNINLNYLNKISLIGMFLISLPYVLKYVFKPSSKMINYIIILTFSLLSISLFLNGINVHNVKLIFKIYYFSIALILMLQSNNESLSKKFYNLAIILSFFGIFLTLFAVIVYFFGELTRINSRWFFSVKIGQLNLFTQLAYGLPERVRFTSIYENPNTFGLMALLISFFSMYLIVFSERKEIKNKVLGFTSLFLSSLGVLLSKSRSSIFIFILFLFVILILLNLDKLKYFIERFNIGKKTFLLIILISFVTISFIMVLGVNRGSGTNNRLNLWSYTIGLLKDHLFFGYGVGNIDVLLKKSFQVNSVHNGFLQILVEGGLLFFTLYFSLWVGAMLISIKSLMLAYDECKSQSYRSNSFKFSAFIVSAFIAILFYQFFESKLLKLGPLNLVAILLLFSQYSYQTEFSKEPKEILLLSNQATYTYKFRKEIISNFIKSGYNVSVVVPNAAYVEKITDLGATHFDINFDNKSKNPLKDIIYFIDLFVLIKFLRPDYILSYTIKPNIYGGMISKLFGIPLIANITGLGTGFSNSGKESLLQKVIHLLYVIGLKNVSVIFFQNESNLNFFKENIDMNVNAVLIPGSGVNLKDFQYQSYPLSDENLKFVYISRIMKEKGIELYLESARRLKEKYKNLEFHICGYCEEDYTHILKYAEDAGTVVYHGLVDDVPSLLKNIHCTIHPTYYPEGMSNALLESAALGKPLIGSLIPGVQEIIDHSENGFLFEANNVEDLIDKMTHFIELSHSDKSNMSKASRLKVERDFNRDIVVSKYLKYINILGGVE